MRQAIAIAGYGSVSALGIGNGAFDVGLREGTVGVRRAGRFAASPYGAIPAGFVPGYEDDVRPSEELTVEFATLAAREALAMAAPVLGAGSSRRTALVLGTSLGDQLEPHAIAERLAAALGLRGPCLTVSSACTSSTHALGIAQDLLDADHVDVVIAGGADALSGAMMAGFEALSVLSHAPCTPFGVDVGTSLGEGAAFFVLVRDDGTVPSERPRLLGYGVSSDAFHETAPEPRGAGVVVGLRRALVNAECPREAIEYVNAHGTGTAANDPAEVSAVFTVLGHVPVSSQKGTLGHAQGAAGALELVATLLCLSHGTIPPTYGTRIPRKNAPADAVLEPRPRASDVRSFAKLSSAFGGSNCALVLGPARRSAPRPSRPVYVESLALFTPFASEAADVRAYADGRPPLRGLRLDERTALPRIDTRGSDPSARMLTAAVRRALLRDGTLPSAERREATGLFVGTPWVSPESGERFEASRAGVDARPSATAFARVVLNAASGSATKALGLRGPSGTFTVGQGTGLVPFALAADYLALHHDTDTLVAAVVEERFAKSEAFAAACDGSVAARLGVVPAGALARIAAVGFGARGASEEAARSACARAGVDREVPIVVGPRDPIATSPALASSLSFVLGVQALASSAGRPVLVLADGGTLSTAILLEVP